MNKAIFDFTSVNVVCSIRALTILANSLSLSFSKYAVIIGVLIFLLELIISLILKKPKFLFNNNYYCNF